MCAFVARFRELIAEEPLPSPLLGVYLSAPAQRITIARAATHFSRLSALVHAGIGDGSIRDCDVTVTVNVLLSGLYSLDYHTLPRTLGEKAFHRELLTFVQRSLAP